MRNFISVSDIGPLDRAVAEALEVKANRFAYKHLGENRTLMMRLGVAGGRAGGGFPRCFLPFLFRLMQGVIHLLVPGLFIVPHGVLHRLRLG